MIKDIVAVHLGTEGTLGALTEFLLEIKSVLYNSKKLTLVKKLLSSQHIINLLKKLSPREYVRIQF